MKEPENPHNSCRKREELRSRIEAYAYRIFEIQGAIQEANRRRNERRTKQDVELGKVPAVYTGSLSGDDALWKASELAEIKTEGRGLGLSDSEVNEMLETAFKDAKNRKSSFD